jgi:hypothetical protein
MGEGFIYLWLNLGPILAATLAGLAVGSLWASLTEPPGWGRGGPAAFALRFGAELWLAGILAGALILAPVTAGRWVVALGSAFIIWVGFVLPALLVTLRARGHSPAVALRDCARWLLVMLVQAAVLRALGLTPPPGAG